MFSIKISGENFEKLLYRIYLTTLFRYDVHDSIKLTVVAPVSDVARGPRVILFDFFF